jgi:hypothetical protein
MRRQYSTNVPKGKWYDTHITGGVDLVGDRRLPASPAPWQSGRTGSVAPGGGQTYRSAPVEPALGARKAEVAATDPRHPCPALIPVLLSNAQYSIGRACRTCTF